MQLIGSAPRRDCRSASPPPPIGSLRIDGESTVDRRREATRRGDAARALCSEYSRSHSRTLGRPNRRSVMETMIGIAVLLVAAGVLWVCFAYGVYLFTRTGREGMRIQRMEDERRERGRPHDCGTPADRLGR